MTEGDLKDLRIWKANLEVILEDNKIRYSGLESLISITELIVGVRPELLSNLNSLISQKEDERKAIEHIEHTIILINQQLEAMNDEHVNNNKTNAKQEAGQSTFDKRHGSVFIQMPNIFRIV